MGGPGDPHPVPAAVLAPLIEGARRQWPALELDDGAFARFLDARRPASAPPGDWQWLGALRAADLYLACACLAGDDLAIALLYDLAELVAREVVERHPDSAVPAADLHTNVVTAMLEPAAGGPRLAQYGGRGSLSSFLRVCALRMVLDDGRSIRARHVPLDDVRLAERALGAREDEELGRLKTIYRPAFEATLREALVSLAPRDRNLIRLHHMEKLQFERIAALYKVHTATAWRWLERVHRELREDVLRRLAARLGTPLDEAESILRLCWSHVDESLQLVTKDPDGA